MKKTAFDIIEGHDLTGKVFLITGGYAGLGAVTTQALLSAKATVIIAGRSKKSQEEFIQGLKENPEITYDEKQLDGSHTIDLGDLASVRDFSKYILNTYQQLDCLINNAGVMNTPPEMTKNGFEIQMGINVIGHFLLSKILVDITKRQVWLSSKGHIRYGAPGIDYEAITKVDEKNYIPRSRYQQAKLGDILLAKHFAKKYSHLTAYSVHPGGVKTDLGRYMTLGQKLKFIVQNPLIVMSMVKPEVGAATQVMVAVLPDSALTNGEYYADCQVTATAPSGRDMDDAKKLFVYCDEATKKFQE